MSTHITSEVKDITPEYAYELMTTCRYDHQRPFRKERALRLAQAMQEGKFTGNEIHLCYLVNGEGGHWYITNGQHTLAACLDSYVTLKDQILIRKRVADERELAHEYATRDRGGRTPADTLRAYGIGQIIGNESDAAISNVQAAIAFILSGYTVSRRKRLEPEELVGPITRWSRAIKDYYAAVEHADISRKLKQRGVAAIGITTYHYAFDHAEDFWPVLVADDRLPAYDPRKTLRKFVTASEYSRGQQSNAEMEYTCRAAVLAWNHWYPGNRDAQVRLLRVADHRSSISLKGTPVKDAKADWTPPPRKG